MTRQKSQVKTVLWTAVTIVVGIAAVWVYFRYQHYISPFIRNLGPLGVIASVILMAILSIIPFPAEFLMVVDMQIYGVWLGILYVWMGAMLGAYVTFLMAKRFGESWIRRFVAQKHLQRLSHTVDRYGSFGLLLSRLIPFIPFVVLNYASAMLPEVSTWTYLWTTGLGIVPYDLGAALIFLGVSNRTLVWLIVGGVAILLIWLTTIWLRARHGTRDKSPLAAKGQAPAGRQPLAPFVHGSRKNPS